MGTKISKYKFYFMRHGETIYNSIKDKSAKYNPLYADCHLSNEGILQSKSKQSFFNKLDIEAIYVSPYYRAIQTMQYCLETHPNADKIIAYIHPNLAELSGMIHEFILDIKETKKDFNMNSKVKIDWSYFDEYAKKSKYDENFLFFENMNFLDEKIKEEKYLKLKSLYDKGDIQKYKDETGRLLKENLTPNTRFESFKHSYERFEEFKKYLLHEFKDTINNKEQKILCICHSAFISIATSPYPFLKDDVKETREHLFHPKNAEIISIFF